MTLFLLTLLTESLLLVFGTRWNCSINTCYAEHMCTCLGVYPLTLGLPSNKLTVCYVKLPFGSRIYPWKSVIFHSFLYVDQRVLPIEYLIINHYISYPLSTIFINHYEPYLGNVCQFYRHHRHQFKSALPSVSPCHRSWAQYLTRNGMPKKWPFVVNGRNLWSRIFLVLNSITLW